MWWQFSAAEAAEAEFLRPAFMAYLRKRGTKDSDYEAAETIFGELIGNVVRHAPGPIWVHVVWNRSAPVLTVTDRGPGFTPVTLLPVDVMAESGRGLFIVRAFGEAMTVEPNPGGGSRVVVTLPITRRDSPVGTVDVPYGPTPAYSA